MEIIYISAYIVTAVLVFFLYMTIFVSIYKKNKNDPYNSVAKYEVDFHTHIAAMIALVWPIGVPLVLLELGLKYVIKKVSAKNCVSLQGQRKGLAQRAVSVVW